MSEGQKAADDVKGTAHQANQPFENLRQNINSFADNLVGRNDGPPTSSTMGSSSTPGKSSTGIHPDAQKTAEGMARGTGAMVGAAEKEIDKHKKT